MSGSYKSLHPIKSLGALIKDCIFPKPDFHQQILFCLLSFENYWSGVVSLQRHVSQGIITFRFIFEGNIITLVDAAHFEVLNLDVIKCIRIATYFGWFQGHS